MHRLTLPSPPDGLSLLVIGAHADDIEIGCGGTILRLATEGRLASVRWVVLSAPGERATEARAGAAAFLAGVARSEVLVADFRDGFLPYLGGAVKDYFEVHRDSFAPDLVLTPRRDDQHQDHRLAGELTWNTYRNHMILEYEIPKYDGDGGVPNLYVELDEATCARKIELIGATFPSQAARQWFDPDAFRAVLRLRGLECCSPTRLAEAFTCRKVVL